MDRVFPDARFVMTHRDPTNVMVSAADLYEVACTRFSRDVDRHCLGRLDADHWSLAMQRLMALRAGGADARLYDLSFRDLQCDPIGAVRGLYAWLGEPVGAAFEAGMRRRRERNASEREENVHPDAAEFGLHPCELDGRFAEHKQRLAAWLRAAGRTRRGRPMTLDPTGGLEPEREFLLDPRPSDDAIRESVNLCAWDDGGPVGLPRIGIEALTQRWYAHDVRVNVVLADGRVLTVVEPGAAHPVSGSDAQRDGWPPGGSGERIAVDLELDVCAVHLPWLADLRSDAEDVDLVLETAQGRTEIFGEVGLSAFTVMGALEGFALQQALVRYEHDGMHAHGLVKQSHPGRPRGAGKRPAG